MDELELELGDESFVRLDGTALKVQHATGRQGKKIDKQEGSRYVPTLLSSSFTSGSTWDGDTHLNVSRLEPRQC